MTHQTCKTRLFEKAGFKYEGTLREVILRFGKFYNVKVYNLLQSEFLENQ